MNIKEYLAETNLANVKKNLQYKIINIINYEIGNINKISEEVFSANDTWAIVGHIYQNTKEISNNVDKINGLNIILDSVYNAKTIEELEEIDLKEYI